MHDFGVFWMLPSESEREMGRNGDFGRYETRMKSYNLRWRSIDFVSI